MYGVGVAIQLIDNKSAGIIDILPQIIAKVSGLGTRGCDQPAKERFKFDLGSVLGIEDRNDLHW